LIRRRKVYPTSLRRVLGDTHALRQTADYQTDQVNEREAARALYWSRSLLDAVEQESEQSRVENGSHRGPLRFKRQ
jgi:uncharacterized protein (UPF0332 family)